VQPRSQNPFNLHLTSSSSVIAEQDGTAGKKTLLYLLVNYHIRAKKKTQLQKPAKQKKQWV
jgi:hypothetical protein